jgi:hypothetical protein
LVINEVRFALAVFARDHGRQWKAALRHLWSIGKDEGYLRHARNLIGPTGLDKITHRMLRRAEA